MVTDVFAIISMKGSQKRTIVHQHVGSEIGHREHSGFQHGAKYGKKAQNLTHVEPFLALQGTFSVNMQNAEEFGG